VTPFTNNLHADGILQRGSGGSDDEDGGHDEDVSRNATHGLSDLEYGMARYRGLLEKKYGNDHDSGYSFVSSDGTTLPLTPLMMKEWSRACVRGILFPHSCTADMSR
jgi:hypothetical protein